MKIGNQSIGGNHTFIIAEIGNNHNGSIDRAKELVDLAISTGVDCVKFQMRQLDSVYRQRSLEKSGEDLGTEYVIDLLKRFELTKDEHREICDYCAEKGILYLCTPWDIESIEILESFKVPAYKVASADLTNTPLLDALAKTGKPLILSTGMSRIEEITKTSEFLDKRSVDYALLHCNSTYPAPFDDINLKWMNRLKEVHSLVGYSGHERGIAVSIASVALGAAIVERHFTLDRNMEGPDHAASLETDDFKAMVDGIREVEASLGSSSEERKMSQGEMINRENLSKSLVASQALTNGTLIEPKHIKVLSPGQGISPHRFDDLVGKKLDRDIGFEDFFFESDIDGNVFKPGQYSFKLAWGIPVRFHDFAEYNKLCKPDLFEFHMSYSDMDLNVSDFLSGTYDSDFVVHAPELFEGSHLMDLATKDRSYRDYSIVQTQRLVDLTKAMKPFFPKTKKPLIVANVGGFSMDQPMDKSFVNQAYETFAESLKELDLEGVELIPQTMAPFPWHFGGQRFQNIFVQIDEITEWCRKLNLRMCFDVSHSHLTCTHFGLDFYDFVEKIAPISAHLHLGDAKGTNGEGLQVGEGDIDFERIGTIFKEKCPNSSFIPEIWQGHKNGGEGFWIALAKLDGML